MNKTQCEFIYSKRIITYLDCNGREKVLEENAL